MWKDADVEIERLLTRCRAGDRDAWTKLVERLQSTVFGVTRRLGLSEADAADVFQATFIALYRNLDRIDQALTLPRWIAVTATRECYRVRRTYPEATGSADERTLEDTIAVEQRSAEEIAIESERALVLREGLEQLGGRCRVLLTLLYGEVETSYIEIGAKLGMPIGAIGPTRARCLEKLRKILEREAYFREVDVSPERVRTS
ncbi:MAG TPA: sigma-70 family RNA polymerase sigma factor [Fimbriimonadaceae bacterium]|nr:sigma-70 family RNA polymerase sigma factor [Fimbriimonadaceae bacterium]